VVSSFARTPASFLRARTSVITEPRKPFGPRDALQTVHSPTVLTRAQAQTIRFP